MSRLGLIIIFGLIGGLAACTSGPRQSPNSLAETPGVFIAPPEVTPTSTPKPQQTQLTAPTSEIAAPSPTPNCINDLKFFQDLSIADGTIIQPGAKVDKRWMVENTGSCDWDQNYSLRLVQGDALNLATTQALVPAKSNTNAIIQLIFTAPDLPGEYISVWQAFDPAGVPFGEQIYLQIVVKESDA
jgi:next to BRCA1 gene 1 protein